VRGKGKLEAMEFHEKTTSRTFLTKDPSVWTGKVKKLRGEEKRKLIDGKKR